MAASPIVCPECKSGALEPGRLVDYWGVRFRPYSARFWKGGRPVEGWGCPNCGYLSLRVVKGDS